MVNGEWLVVNARWREGKGLRLEHDSHMASERKISFVIGLKDFRRLTIL